jgi:hypothetical protein
MLHYAVGPKVLDPTADKYWQKPETDGEKALCTAQKVKKQGGLVYVCPYPVHTHTPQSRTLTPTPQKHQPLWPNLHPHLLPPRHAPRHLPPQIPNLPLPLPPRPGPAHRALDPRRRVAAAAPRVRGRGPARVDAARGGDSVDGEGALDEGFANSVGAGQESCCGAGSGIWGNGVTGNAAIASRASRGGEE